MIKIKNIDIYEYCLRLVKPLNIKKNTLITRKGMIIELIDKDGFKGFGEIAPLPFFSTETLEDARNQIMTFKEEIVSDLSGIKNIHLFPSVRCGIEMAVFNLKYLKTAKKLQTGDRHILINKLLDVPSDFNEEKIKELAINTVTEGYKSVKIKVARQSVDKDILSINILKAVFEGKISVRLDANNLWNLDEAIYFGAETGYEGIDYIEDPVNSIDDYERFYIKTKIPVALDRTLEKFFERFPASVTSKNSKVSSKENPAYFIKAIVLKPTMLGGFNITEKFVNFASKHNIIPVTSSSFETGLGISSIALFTETQGLASVATGLDTLSYFADDIICGRLEIIRGTLNLKNAEENIKAINKMKLKRII